MNLPQEFLDYHERLDRLARFDAGLEAVLREGTGQHWIHATPADEERLLTPRQRDWRELRSFYEAIANSGDLFRYLSIVYTRPELFEQIEASKTLAAANGLKEYHYAYSQLATEDEKNKFWFETREEREAIERTAEDICEFADLLIRFAERHPEEFREMEAGNPLDRVCELMGSLRNKVGEAGHDTKRMGMAIDLIQHLRKSLSNTKKQSQ